MGSSEWDIPLATPHSPLAYTLKMRAQGLPVNILRIKSFFDDTEFSGAPVIIEFIQVRHRNVITEREF